MNAESKKYPHMPSSEEVARRKAIARMVDDPVCSALTEEQRQQLAREFPEGGRRSLATTNVKADS